MTLLEALNQVLQLNPVDHIHTYNDIQTTQDKQLTVNVINQLRNITNLLSQSQEKTLQLFNKDYYQLFVEAIAVAQQEFVDDQGNPIWTDFRLSNIGTFFLELMATELDKAYFLTDRIFAQFSTPTMSFMKYFFLRSEELGSKPLLRTSASTTLRFRIIATRTNAVRILTGTQVQGNGGVIFETTSTVFISSGEIQVDVPARNHTTTVITPVFSGLPNAVVQLQEVGVLDETFAVVINAIVYTKVDDFFDSLPGDHHFTVTFTDDERAFLTFGDGTNGFIPIGPSTIAYQFGGGAIGNNLSIGSITTILSTILDTSNHVVSDIAVTNITATAGGQDQPPLEIQIPELVKNVKNLTRTVTLQDFEDNATSIPGVARALALDVVLDPSIPRGTIVLYIVPTAGTVVDTELINNIQFFFQDRDHGRPMMHDKILQVNEANYLDVDLTGVVFVKKSFDPAVLTSIQAVISQFFDPLNKDSLGEFTMDWGFKKPTIYYSQITSLVHLFDDQGVRNVTLTSITPANLPVPKLLFPRLININNLTLQVVDDAS